LAKKPKNENSMAASSPMNVDLLERLTRLMKDNDLNTVDVRDGDKRVILKRGALIEPGAGAGFAAANLPAFAASNSHAGAQASSGSSDETAGMLTIKSPMVGTFYSSSSPEAKPFVSVGSTVDEETDVCIIEAMKVFNNIKAECKGTIAKTLVENGETVEFGQILFLVKPS
jgi:acetyl-CoA carboxylase biotin carboxyl carrier protein